MRPPLSATPPVSHVMSRQFEPTPSITCHEDWRDLTNNTSIQIMSLESSACHEENLFHSTEISNQLRFVDTIISPKQEDTFPCNKHFAETIVSLDSLIHHHGNALDARIIFTPKIPSQKTEGRPSETGKKAHKDRTDFSKCPQRKIRNVHSDSALHVMANRCHGNEERQNMVARSKSLSYAVFQRKNDSCLVQPIRPCINKSKVGDIKRIPSFRSKAKPVAIPITRSIRTPLREKDVTDLNKSTVESKIETRNNAFLKVQNNNVKRNSSDMDELEMCNTRTKKISKIVKSGLKSVMKSNNQYTTKAKDVSRGSKNMTSIERRRYRKTRFGTDIGGLSEFLRRNERRNTVGVLTETDKLENARLWVESLQKTHHESSGSPESKNRGQIPAYTPVADKNDSRVIMGSRRIHSTGTSNLKFNQCQRRLDFQNNFISSKTWNDKDRLPNLENMENIESENVSQQKRRPRLGIMGDKKPVKVITIDELDMDIVFDLKRRIELSARRSKVKTNGTLKIKPEVKIVGRPTPSPRCGKVNRLSGCRYGVKLVPLKRESTV